MNKLKRIINRGQRALLRTPHIVIRLWTGTSMLTEQWFHAELIKDKDGFAVYATEPVVLRADGDGMVTRITAAIPILGGGPMCEIPLNVVTLPISFENGMTMTLNFNNLPVAHLAVHGTTGRGT